MNKVSTKVMISTLSTSAWRAYKQHKEETYRENERHGTQDVALVSVRLTRSPILQQVYKAQQRARILHYKLTVPSTVENMRLIPCGMEMKHSEQIGKMMNEHDKFVAKFVEKYDEIRAQAREEMKTLYDPRHWPNDIRGRFQMIVHYLPISDSDVKNNESLSQWEQWLKDSEKTVKEDLSSRISEKLSHFVKKLREDSEEHRFHNSTVTNLMTICDLCQDLNIMDDPQINDLISQVRPFGYMNPDILRENDQERKDAANRADEILKAFNL